MTQLQRTDQRDTSTASPDVSRRRGFHKGQGWLAVAALLLLLLLTILPPLVSVSRYQRRVATSMSQVLGRPVHLDHVALNLLPFPSLTLTNLVIDELPPFGAEPIVRATSVNARLRLGPLWWHRVEFSRISFSEPSVNLVRYGDGRWNLENVLLQAAHINAAPTAQRRAGGQPRFPYIEATRARVNLKMNQEKMPFSLLETDFALWLPEPQVWRVRLRGRPARTDTSATDTGTVRVEASLQRANSIGDVPLALDASWDGAPLGEASRVMVGRDAGLRGGLRLAVHMKGTLADAAIQSEFAVSDLHRVDLVADRAIDVDFKCLAEARRLLHALEGVACSWSPDNTGEVRLIGSLPDVLSPGTARMELSADRVSGATALRWLRAATGQIAPGLRASGELSARAVYTPENGVTGQLQASPFTLAGDDLKDQPVSFGPIAITAELPRFSNLARKVGPELSLAPVSLSLNQGGTDAAAGPMTLSLGADQEGLSMRLAGTALPRRVQALVRCVPVLDEGLEQVLPHEPVDMPTAVDLVAHRPWGGPQQWRNLQTVSRVGASPSPPATISHRHH